MSKVSEGRAEIVSFEFGPVTIGDPEFGVADLPEQEVADAKFAGGADDEVGVGHAGGHECGGDGVFVDAERVELAVFGGLSEFLHGECNFLSGTVVDGEAECHAVVVGGELFGGGDFLLDDGVKSRDDSDDAESESLAVNFAAFFDEVLSEELHEEREFAGWSFPVFAGEAVEGELLESEPGGFFDDGAN